MADASWEKATAQLLVLQRDFAGGDAERIKRLYSHREDVTVFGGFGGSERGWAEVGPRLDWAASQFSGGTRYCGNRCCVSGEPRALVLHDPRIAPKSPLSLNRNGA